MSKINTRSLISIALVITSILSACMLWFTRSEWQESLSAFALSDNVMWYRLMHLSASWFLILNYKSSWHNLIIGFGMGLILIFDMYHYFTIHAIVTVATIVFTCYSLIINSKDFEQHLMFFLSGVAVLVFGIGYFDSTFHLLLAEIIAMLCLMTGKLREFYLKKT